MRKKEFNELRKKELGELRKKELTAQSSEREQLGLERIIFFSDAVFAIAITLLALELRVPDLPMDQAAAQLPTLFVEMTPKFLSYVLSFLIIGSYWITHHRDFQIIQHYDRRLIWINLLLLMFVAFLPFPTAMLGNYPATQFTVTFYAASLAALGFVNALLWWYASRNHRLVDPALESQRITLITRRSLIAPFVFLFSILVAIFNPLIAMWSWSLVGVAIWLTSSDTVGG